jgi:four helix bundle protein
MAVYKHFYELPVYKIAGILERRFVCWRDHFLKVEKFLLTGQLLDAARSITANIAEGFGRFHHQENIQFCRQARGSLSETMEHLITAYDDTYIDKKTLEVFYRKYKTCLQEINSYIKNLKTAKLSTIINY